MRRPATDHSSSVNPTAAPYSLGLSTLDAETSCARLPTSGEFPSWLRGTLLRNGPARFEVGRHTYRHWFDGLAMLHKFTFRAGEVSYANRFLRGQAYSEALAAGRISRGEFATNPPRSLARRVRDIFSRPATTDNAAVNLTRLDDRFVALTETTLPVIFSPETLATEGHFEFADDLFGHLTTAHPHHDATGSWNYAIQFSRTSRYLIYHLPRGSRTRRLVASIPSERPAYMHSFAVTRRYVVLFEFPLVVNPLRLMLGARPLIENYRWLPARGSRLQVIDKESGAVLQRYETEACFAFHHVNAFEQQGEIVLDLTTYKDASIIRALYLDRLREGRQPIPSAELRRFRLHLDTGRVRAETLCAETVELPRINYPRCNGESYRYVYGVGNRQAGGFSDQLVKFYVERGARQTWAEESCYAGEPVFVSAPASAREDEGVVLSVVLDAARGRSFLLLLDAQSFTERARAELPHHIPFGFHGQYCEDLSGASADAQLHR